MLDYLRLAIGLFPLGIYLLVMGLLTIKRKPTLLTSGQEALLVGFALSGFALIGPIELFFPTGAYATLGEWVWFILMLLYGLIVVLFALQRAPGWSVLGLDSERLRAVLSQVLTDASVEHAWLGNQIEIPSWSLRAIVEPSRAFVNTSHLSPCGKQQDLVGWYELEKHVASSMVFLNSQSPRHPGTLTLAVCLITLSASCLIASVTFVDWDMDRIQKLITRILGA